MISVSDAIAIVQSRTGHLGTHVVELRSAVGRVLAEDIVADTDLPPFHRSQMDGFAVVGNDTIHAPVGLKIVGESAAGRGWHRELRSGEAVRIMTGAPVPNGADAVQKVEMTTEKGVTGEHHDVGGFVNVLEAVKTGANIVRKGSEILSGETIFSSGEVITENMIASLAAFGYAKVRVSRQPHISILGTGSEIVDITESPGRDQIRNSNSIMIDVLSRKFGATTTVLPNAKDEISNLKSEIEKAVSCSDILVMTGGVSVGKYDLTKLALTELGAEIFFDRISLKPGKPMVFAKLNETLIFGLPGNPVSAAVTFYLFVRMAILQMQSAAEIDLRRGFAILAYSVKAAKERDTYFPARLETDREGRLIATPLRSQGSSDFIGFARAEALIFVPKGNTCDTGDVVKISYL